MIKWKPKFGDEYYTPDTLLGEASDLSYAWSGSKVDTRMYEAGIVCRTKEEAIELARKMLAVARERVGKC